MVFAGIAFFILVTTTLLPLTLTHFYPRDQRIHHCRISCYRAFCWYFFRNVPRQVEHVLSSDSESDSGNKDADPSSSKEQASEQPAPPVNETNSNSDNNPSSLATATSTPPTPVAATATSSARACSATPMCLLPVVEADSPAAALEAAVASAKAAGVNGEVEPVGINVAEDSAPSQEGELVTTVVDVKD